MGSLLEIGGDSWSTVLGGHLPSTIGRRAPQGVAPCGFRIVMWAAMFPGPVELVRWPTVTSSLRLLSVHAHPDDEASKGAATVARYAAEGVESTLVCCTGGEAGEVLNPAMDRPEVWENLEQVRLQ